MNKNDLIKLSQIFNTLCLVHVCGKDAVLMGKSIEAFEEFIYIKEQELKNQEINNQPME